MPTVIDHPSKIIFHRLQKFSDQHWGKHFQSPEETKINFFDNPKLIIKAKIDGKLVGLVNIFIRTITFKGIKLVLGGIGGVVTHQEFRRCGVATATLRRAVIEMEKQGVDISLLCTDTDKLGSFYQKVGYQILGRPYYYFNKFGQEKPDTGGMIKAITQKVNVTEIINSSDKLSVGNSDF